MKNKTKIKRIVLYLVAIMFISWGAAALIAHNTPDNWIEFKAGNLESIQESREFAIDDIDKIKLSTVSDDINIITEERPDIRIELSGKANKNDIELLASREGDELKIEVKHKPRIYFGFHGDSELNLSLALPPEYNGDMEISNTSGDLDLSEINTEEFTFNTVSGNLSASSINAQKTKLDSISGDIKIEKLSGDFDCKTISGDIELGYPAFTNNIDIETTSGSTVLQLPANAGFMLESESVSGNIKCDFPITISEQSKGKGLNGIVGKAANRIVFESVSGDLNIKNK